MFLKIFVFALLQLSEELCPLGVWSTKWDSNFQRVTTQSNLNCPNENRFWIIGKVNEDNESNNLKINLQNSNFNLQRFITEFGTLTDDRLIFLLDHEFNVYYQNILHLEDSTGKSPISYCDPLPLVAGEMLNVSILVNESNYQLVYYRNSEIVKTMNYPKSRQPSVLDIMGNFEAGSIQIYWQKCCEVNANAECRFEWGDWDQESQKPTTSGNGHEGHGHGGHGNEHKDGHGGHGGHEKGHEKGHGKDHKDKSHDGHGHTSRDTSGDWERKSNRDRSENQANDSNESDQSDDSSLKNVNNDEMMHQITRK